MIRESLKLLSSTRGILPLVEYLFHLPQEFRRKKWLFQNVCVVFTQFGELIAKARYEQQLRFGACCTKFVVKAQPRLVRA
jgi:hypothetical protein